MGNLDAWDWGLLSLAGYIAVVGLVRLMIAQREKSLAELRWQVEAEQRRQRLAAQAEAAAPAPDRRARAA